MLKDDIAKSRFGYYEHFLRSDHRRAPPATSRPSSAAETSGRGKTFSRTPFEPQAWRRSPPPPRVRPASGHAGVRQLSARHSPTVAALSRAASPGPPSSEAPEPRRPTSAPPCLAGRAPQSPRGDATDVAHALGGGFNADRRSRSAHLQSTAAGTEEEEPDWSSPRWRPPFGSIYYPCGQRMRNPGPGHYVDASQSFEIGFTPDPCQSQAWAHFGNRTQEQTPENLEMFNIANAAVGPGKYRVESAHVSKQSPQWRFASMPTHRLVQSRKSGPRSQLPMHCHQDPRFAHRFPPKPPGEGSDRDHAWEQGLAVRCARPAVPRVDQRCKEPRLNFHGAAFRLGGHMWMPSGNDAGPRNVSSEAAQWRREEQARTPRQPREPQRPPGKPRRPASAAVRSRSFGFSRARRF